MARICQTLLRAIRESPLRIGRFFAGRRGRRHLHVSVGADACMHFFGYGVLARERPGSLV